MGMTITDWSGMTQFIPSFVLKPQTLVDLAIMLENEAANQPPGRVRVLGGLHSCAPIIVEDTVIDLSDIPLQFTPLPGMPGKVEASGWMTVREFLTRAAAHGLSLTALGGTDAQTLGGLLATNTAGATAHHGIYETIDWVEYLTIDSAGAAVLRRVSATDPDFRAMSASLGCVGVVTKVCFNLVQERYFEAEFKICEMSSVLDDLDATCAAHEFWRIEWLPNDRGQGLFWSAHPILKGDPAGDYTGDDAQKLLKTVAGIIQQTRHNGPFLNLELEITYDVLMAVYSPSTASGPMRNIIPCDRATQLHVAMAEWSFRKNDLPRVMRICRQYFQNTAWPNLPIEIECTKRDTYFMSPWNWPGEPYIVKLNFQYLTDFLMNSEKPAILQHLHGLWDKLQVEGVAFKAHWGKINFLTPTDTAALYDVAGFGPFMVDLFMNDYLRDRL